MALGSRSLGISHIFALEKLLGKKVVAIRPRLLGRSIPAEVEGLLGWGQKANTAATRRMASKHRLPFIAIEDGFLRSFSTGSCSPPLSLVIDELGIYYDSIRPSKLESLLNEPDDFALRELETVRTACDLLRRHHLSKYNAAPAMGEGSSSDPVRRPKVLVVDQTQGDVSVVMGAACAATFQQMLTSALNENPDAVVYVKTHPEVIAGLKCGYLTNVHDGDRTEVIREPVSPASLIDKVERVYVVTSGMGFDALLAGKAVTCFGVPWYAGWGVTDDRVKDSPAWARRVRRRTVEELFSAAYLHYTRYLNPETHERGTIFDVIHWLVRQKAMADHLHGADRKGRVIGVGFRRWKAFNLKPLLGLHEAQVLFAASARKAAHMKLRAGDTLAFWGPSPPAGLEAVARNTSAKLMHVEDGFIRSVGLGSDLVPPRSLVLDSTGIYFDATRPSDLEQILSSAEFSTEDLAEARRVREFIVQHGLTKYNLEPRERATWKVPPGRTVVVVPGQVEDDASIHLGCTTVHTNLALLQAVRASLPDAFIVYKPHPDVQSGNRKGHLPLRQALAMADHVETELSITSCIDACDELHTMTSLSGFDALLRGKRVVTYGQPFYAGWGLTDDRCRDGPAFSRRQRRLGLDELVAGALIRYPIYWDPVLKGYTTCMAVLRQILSERETLERAGKLAQLRTGFIRRLVRKTRIITLSWINSLKRT
jgi:capsular polysaccharide export protein